ncbi:hypothetical protein [Arthrobacter sp. NyZ413]|uniref:hypothetical protein n=1 Tax=Arthrobacter sp. NyZ413 TaxID=3144669 RepID=UPI003BF8FA86
MTCTLMVASDPPIAAAIDPTAGSVHGPIIAPLDIAAAKVVRTVGPGDEFQFVFDLGDSWMHRCVVGEVKIDPVEVLGINIP